MVNPLKSDELAYEYMLGQSRQMENPDMVRCAPRQDVPRGTTSPADAPFTVGNFAGNTDSARSR
jgi:hypothetical protein